MPRIGSASSPSRAVTGELSRVDDVAESIKRPLWNAMDGSMHPRRRDSSRLSVDVSWGLEYRSVLSYLRPNPDLRQPRCVPAPPRRDLQPSEPSIRR